MTFEAGLREANPEEGEQLDGLLRGEIPMMLRQRRQK
jgi:hypothetical protein